LSISTATLASGSERLRIAPIVTPPMGEMRQKEA
jgi:hypothetical protein